MNLHRSLKFQSQHDWRASDTAKTLGNIGPGVYCREMLRLFILRHAKSAWPMPATGDHSRPLNRRGTKALPKIRKMLTERGYQPTLALCSSARRTVETWQGIEPALPDCQFELRDDLYESTTAHYLATITAINGHASAMIIGHNPVCDDLTRLLITGDGEFAAHFLSLHFPTGGLAVLDFETDRWSDVRPTTATLSDFVRPRTL